MAPYDSMRDFAAALEARDKLIRIKEMDQDKYELTALSYKLIDRMKAKAPAFLVEKIKVNGKWHESPVIANIYNGFDNIAQCFGVARLSDDQAAMYDAAVGKIMSYQDKEGHWATMEPKKVDQKDAPCKEVILEGEAADLALFPWIKNNPGDASQYISTGSVIMQDPELGRNVGTYRMQVKGPRKVGVYFTNQSHGYKFMMQAAERGEERVKVSVASGIDPISWMMSCTRLTQTGDDEIAFAGGFREKPVEVVKSETNDLSVPAHAEFVIEGEISMDAEKEGPYGEMLGYIGKEVYTFTIDIQAITHRKNPWVFNVWPGIGGAYMTLPWDVSHYTQMSKMMPNLVKLYTPIETASIVVISIDKQLPGQGIEAGMMILGTRAVGFGKKMVIVVDKDVDVTDMSRVMHAVGTRWQPVPASVLVNHSFHIPIDPSSREMFLSSKIVIDATRQLPSEGGPETYPLDNRAVVEEQAPEGFEQVEKNWESYFKK